MKFEDGREKECCDIKIYHGARKESGVREYGVKIYAFTVIKDRTIFN